jgi:hypothetical protein
MLDKVEFSDLYKFLASLGLGMMVVALCFPFFLFQIDITKNYQVVNSTSGFLKQFILQQEKIGCLLFDWWWVISIIIFFTGGFLFIDGIRKWGKRQSVIDKSQDLDLLEKEKIKKASQSEVDKKLSEDVSEIEEAAETEDVDSRRIVFQTYKSIEKKVIDSLVTVDSTIKKQNNVKVNNFVYDLVIIKRLSDIQRLHKVCEIKYYQKIIHYSYLLQGVSSFLLAANNYERYVVADDPRINVEYYIIWIYANPNQKELLDKYKVKVISYAQEKGIDLRIIVKAESELGNLKEDLF